MSPTRSIRFLAAQERQETPLACGRLRPDLDSRVAGFLWLTSYPVSAQQHCWPNPRPSPDCIIPNSLHHTRPQAVASAARIPWFLLSAQDTALTSLSFEAFAPIAFTALRVDSHPCVDGPPIRAVAGEEVKWSCQRRRSIILAPEIPVGKAPVGESQRALLIYRPNPHILRLQRRSLLAALAGRIARGQSVQRLQCLKGLL